MSRLRSVWQSVWQRPSLVGLMILLAVALGLRLLVWHWHEFRPLGGDEQEYLAQAVHWLQTREYRELLLMRPPIYTVFLAAAIVVVDSLVQSLRLVQVVLSATLVIPVYGLAWVLWRQQRVALVAAALVALDALIATVATELLSETLFLWGLSMVLWGSAYLAQYQGRWHRWLAVAVGVGIGLLILVRSVALPLAALLTVWLVVVAVRGQPRTRWWQRIRPALIVAVAVVAVVAPWSMRNVVTYGGLIVVDTTGAENLWLDNEPQGREYAKAALYAMGDDRYGRQRLATMQGMQQILAHPDFFIAKMSREGRAFFGLTGFDDLRQRRAIWVSPEELWSTLVLGDGIWLVVLMAGILGVWRAPPTVAGGFDWRWVVVPWALYGVLTVLLFHYEPRYRLAIYPVLWAYAAWWLCHPLHQSGWWRWGLSLWMVGLVAGLTVQSGAYPQESWRLLRKHVALAQAQSALTQQQYDVVAVHAEHALAFDPQSALAYGQLAEVALARQQWQDALRWAEAAQTAVPDHPWTRLLRGVALRGFGDLDAARRDLAAETSTRERVQERLWEVMPLWQLPSTRVRVGDGLDLGWVRGFHAAEPDGGRWSTANAAVRLVVPPAAAHIHVVLQADRPAGSTQAQVRLQVGDGPVVVANIGAGATVVVVAVPEAWRGRLVEVRLSSDVVRPRDADQASPDGRWLGVRVLEVRAQ